MKTNLKAITLCIATLATGCATYKAPVEASVTEFRPGQYMVDSRSDARKITRGEAIQMNLFELSKYMTTENQGQCMLYETKKVDTIGNEFVITGVAQVAPCDNPKAIYASSIVKSYSKWYERKRAEFEDEQQKSAWEKALVGALVIGAGVAAYQTK